MARADGGVFKHWHEAVEIVKGTTKQFGRPAHHVFLLEDVIRDRRSERAKARICGVSSGQFHARFCTDCHTYSLIKS